MKIQNERINLLLCSHRFRYPAQAHVLMYIPLAPPKVVYLSENARETYRLRMR